ncbi:MAG: hypothetical protein Q9169_003891 [Polycauliona sp. 2 TL-2023]
MEARSSAESTSSGFGGMLGSNINELSSVWQNPFQLRTTSPGLRNPTLGRCYLNSVVIALLHLPEFVSWLNHHVLKHGHGESCVACVLAVVASPYWADGIDQDDLEGVIDGFTKAIDSGWKESRLHVHEDAQEFYQWLIDNLCPEGEVGLERLFQLRCGVTSFCKECDEEEKSPETDWQLILSCEGNATIEQAIAQYFASIQKPGIECNSPTCKKRKVEKRSKKVVTRQGTEKFVKNESKVSYNSTLNLQPVKNGEILHYKLLAAIHHQGTMKQGHYITVTKTPAGNWVRHDNENVTDVGVQEALQPTRGFTPYLLFWQKEPTDSPKSRKRRPSEDDYSCGSPPKTPKGSGGGTFGFMSKFGFGKKPQEPPSDLTKCEEEKADLNEQLSRAAVAHPRLVVSAHSLSAGLDKSLKMLATLSPLMQELKGKKKYRVRAKAYLSAESLAQRLQMLGMLSLAESPRLTELIDAEKSHGMLKGFLDGCPPASEIGQPGVWRAWLARELELDKGKGIVEGSDVDESLEVVDE